MSTRSKSIFSFDVYVLISTVLLIGIGILFIYSSGVTSDGRVFSNEYIRQMIWAGTGLALLVGVSFVDYRILRSRTVYVYGAALFLLILTLMFGRVVNGARSWLGVGELGIQPSEFAKLATVLFLADYLERTGSQIRRLSRFSMCFLIPLAPLFLTLLQPDLGTALVFIPIFLIMAFVAGAKVKHILFVVGAGVFSMALAVLPAWQARIGGGGDGSVARLFTETHLIALTGGALAVVCAGAGIGYALLRRNYLYWFMYAAGLGFTVFMGSVAVRVALADYQIMRLIVFLDPYVDPRGAGWNLIQSLNAVGSGGLFGKGFLEGPQSHYQFIPQQSTDFIFSILAEEWGFIGAFAVFLLFTVILLRGLYITLSVPDRFGSFIGAGVVALFFFHFAVNVGMAIGIMPITGIPLFFLSYGGSSLWTALLSVGVLMSVYQHRYRY
jgi:rod shape determining protein RodA